MQEIDDPLSGASEPEEPVGGYEGGGAGFEVDPEDTEPQYGGFPWRRLLAVVAIGVLVALMAVLPPLINISRFQHRVAASITNSMGRPVRIDSIQLTLLPLPGIVIQNFVVADDPAFGYEPVMRANTVRATVRVSSLWRRRLEFSTISLEEPSVNLVHLPDGRWNIESILLQAARMDAAPTAQATVGESPRFPYIEATDARVNLKRGMEKLPFSLTDAKFALWLAQPDRWQLRLEGHPNRTDANVTDSGTVRLGGTLGRAATIPGVPVDMTAEWTTAPLGAVSWLVLDEDAGLRGTLDLTASVKGTIGSNALDARLKLKGGRRAEFVPADPLDVDLGCRAQATQMFHTLAAVQCAWPPDAPHPNPGMGLTLTGSVPDVMHPATVQTALSIAGVPAADLVDVLRVASGRTPLTLTLTGTLSGKIAYPAAAPAPGPKSPHRAAPAVAGPASLGELAIQDALLRLGDDAPFVKGPVSAQVRSDGVALAPVPLELGGKEPAAMSLVLRRDGYSIHLSGTMLRSRALAFGAAIPQVGDGLEAALPKPSPVATVEPLKPAPKKVTAAPKAEEPIQVDLLVSRSWGGNEPWTQAPAGKAAPRRTTPRARSAVAVP